MTPIDVLDTSLVGHALRERQCSVGNLRRLRTEQNQLTCRGGRLSSENQTSSGGANNHNDGSQAKKGGSAFAKATADRSGLGFLFHSSFGFSPTVLARVLGVLVARV